MSSRKQNPERFPLRPYLELVLSELPETDEFIRYLTFENPEGKRKRIPVLFKRKGYLRWVAEGPDAFPKGIGSLRKLVNTGYRDYWDRMFLENRGGSRALKIRDLKIIMNYDRKYNRAKGCKYSIPIVDFRIEQTLKKGDHEIFLNPFANLTRYRWAGLDFSENPIVLDAVRDLGKSGSDTLDSYGDNPKYSAEEGLLCSEFVSWYYYEANLNLGTVNFRQFRDVEGTRDLHDIFKAAGRLYRYDHNRKKFIHLDTGKVYRPRAGDFIERWEDGKAEHSMMVLRYHPRKKQVVTLNGPWPVTLRRVDLQKEEVQEGKDYFVGRIDPL